MKKLILAFTCVVVSFFFSNDGCNGTNGRATFDEVVCGDSSYDQFVEQNTGYSPLKDSLTWISETASKKTQVRRKYNTGGNSFEYMIYPLRTVAMASVNDEIFYFYTYLPESSVYLYEELESMVVVVYNCMGRKIKSINYEETSAAPYENVVEEIFQKSTQTYFYSGFYITDRWNVMYKI